MEPRRMELNEIPVSSRPNMTQEVLNMNNLQIVEEGPQVLQDGNMKNLPIIEESPQMSQDINMRDLRIVEEGPRVCPLCSQDVRKLFINFNEKIDMCMNVKCDYPFGYEPVKIFREVNGVQTVEIEPSTSKATCSITGPQSSSQLWTDFNKVSNAIKAVDLPSIDVNKQHTFPTPTLKKTEADQKKEELLQNVEKIKQMTKSLNDMKKEPKRIIKNEKWIKNLDYLQEISGRSLLKREEQKKIKKKAPAPQTSELKIDVDANDLANVRIEVKGTSAPNTKPV